MTRRPSSGGSVGFKVWAVLVAIGAVATALARIVTGQLNIDAVGFMVIAIVYAWLAWVVATRQTGRRIAWLLIAPATWVVFESAALLRLGDTTPDPVTMWDALAIIWLATGWWFALIVPYFLLLHIFPTGRFMGRGWSLAGWLAGLVCAIDLFVEVFARDIGPDTGEWAVANPFGFLPWSGLEEATVFAAIFGFGLVGLLIWGIVAIVVRYRRSSLEVRTQIKWVVFSTILLTTTLMSQILFEFYQGLVANIVYYFAALMLPVSIAMAITKYRLYDIDRLISRTVGYTLLIVVLGAIYVIGAVWVPTELIGDPAPVFVAASTLAVAALFNPARKRILTMVDRRFNRTRYDAQRVVEEFVGQLRNNTHMDQLADDVVGVVGRTLQPSFVGAWIREGNSA